MSSGRSSGSVMMPVVASRKPVGGCENEEELRLGAGWRRAAWKKGDIDVRRCSWAWKETAEVSLLGDAGPPTMRVTERDVNGEVRAFGVCGSGVEGGGPGRALRGLGDDGWRFSKYSSAGSLGEAATLLLKDPELRSLKVAESRPSPSWRAKLFESWMSMATFVPLRFGERL